MFLLCSSILLPFLTFIQITMSLVIVMFSFQRGLLDVCASRDISKHKSDICWYELSYEHKKGFQVSLTVSSPETTELQINESTEELKKIATDSKLFAQMFFDGNFKSILLTLVWTSRQVGYRSDGKVFTVSCRFYSRRIFERWNLFRYWRLGATCSWWENNYWRVETFVEQSQWRISYKVNLNYFSL